MPVSTAIAGGAQLDAMTARRLSDLGFELHDADPGAPGGEAISTDESLAVVLPVTAERRTTVARAREALAEAADAANRSVFPVAVVVIPAEGRPGAGPLAIVSPADSVSSYELSVGAALASVAGRRVVHLNARGTRGSAVHGTTAAPRSGVRAAVGDWRERPAPHIARSLRALDSRPAIVVVAVPPGGLDAASVLMGAADADLVLVFDLAHEVHGAAVAAQLATVIELALEVQSGRESAGAAVDPEAEPRAASPQAAPGQASAEPREGEEGRAHPRLRASDVLHLRLTDRALEASNRTPLRLRTTIALGTGGASGAVGAGRTDRQIATEVSVELGEGESTALPIAEVPALAGLEPPARVVRQWSHEIAEVYEGGELRMIEVSVAVLNPDGTVRANRTQAVPNGLDFSFTARAFTELLDGGVAAPVLPEPAPAAPLRPSGALLAQFAEAVAAGADFLTRLTR